MTDLTETFTQAEVISRMSRDIRAMGRDLSKNQARLLVDRFYQVQHDRIRAAGQIRAAQEAGEPTELLVFLQGQVETVENQVKGALDAYSGHHPMGRWMRGHKGVGPVIAAGLLSHISIERCETVGDLWAFAGLAPGKTWEKGQKIPWNASLKTLCAFKLGESFVKVCNQPDAFYGRFYAEWKERYREKNEAGGFATTAADTLGKRTFRDDTTAAARYKLGKLPDARIHAMARRQAVKLFLSHLHETWRKHEGLPAPPPYVFAMLGHGHYIPPPAPVKDI
jgi:hypothetical protein